MRYIKTYESFYHEDDMVREIAMVLDPAVVEVVDFDPKYKDTSMFRLYQVDGEVDADALENLKGYMFDEHGLHSTFVEMEVGYYDVRPRGPLRYVKSNVRRIILTEKPVKEAFIDWLNTNYSGLEAVDCKGYFPKGSVLYRYEPKDNVLIDDKEDGRFLVSSEKIWSLFEEFFGMDFDGIVELMRSWLGEAYGIDVGSRKINPALSYSYKIAE